MTPALTCRICGREAQPGEAAALATEDPTGRATIDGWVQTGDEGKWRCPDCWDEHRR